MVAHSKIGASSAYRWMKCPGSVRESRGIRSATSIYAAEGTVAHHVAEQALERGCPASQYQGEVFNEAGFDIEVTAEMVDAVDVYLDFIRDVIATAEAEGKTVKLHVEQSFRLEQLHPEAFGTADASIYVVEDRHLHVYDYKHGAGKPVEIEGNPQAKYYGSGALLDLKYPALKITLGIIQPRCPHPDGPIRVTDIDAFDLTEWMGDLQQAMKRTEDPDAPLVPGDHCHWCPAAGKPCPALHQMAVETAKRDFQPQFSYDPDLLADTLAKIPAIEKFCKSVREFAYEKAEHGEPVPGFKLVEKRATRRWRDEDEAIKQLRGYGLDDDQIFKPKAIKTPPQIEKIIGPKVAKEDGVSGLWIAESSGHTLVPESDKRPPAKPTAADDFGGME